MYFKWLKQLRIENDYSAVSWDVAQRSFIKYTAEQMSFESGFNVLAHLISSGSWFIITKRHSLVLCEPLVFLTDSILMIWVVC